MRNEAKEGHVIMKFLSFLTVLVLLQGCATDPVQKAEVKTARAIPSGADAKPIQFRRIVVKMRRGDPIGKSQLGPFCVPLETLEWRGGRVNITDDEFTETFREELQNANYPVVGDPNALFDDPSTWKAELLVAGLINKIEANACFPLVGLGGNFRDVKGGAFIRVNWQIFGQLERKVVYETTTEGSYETTETKSGGLSMLLTRAFAVAVQNLLADSGFHNLVLRPEAQKGATLSEPAYPPILLDAAPMASGSVANARAGAVTVLAGSGHGSGFVVSPSGYVITNYHVVKEARFVKVRLANGREILGDVIRTDPVRDVALIKTRESNIPSLSLRLNTSPNVGEEVYAIGTPLLEKLDVTVTRGIVSAYRDEGGLKYIQSDVQIHQGASGGPLVDKDGRVVGISVMALTRSGVSQNLNFFVPISDAVSRLRIDFK